MTVKLLQTGLAMHRRGFAVVPIPHKGFEYRDRNGEIKHATGKGPVIPNWQDGRLSEERLKRELSNNHITALGVVSGALSGNLVVLDFDKEGWHRAFEHFEHSWPELSATTKVVTGSGKRHVWVLCPDLGDFTRKEYKRPDLDASIELRGNGCNNVFAGQHPDGGQYGWAELESELVEVSLAELRAWLEEWAGVEDKQPFKMPERLPEGIRDVNIFKSACSLRAKGFSKSAALAACLAENEAKGTPPLPESQVRAKVESAYGRYPPGQHTAAEEFIDGKTFIPPRLGRYILGQVPFANLTREKTTGHLYSYHRGVYKRDGAARVAELAGEILGDAYRDNRAEETTRWIEMKTRTDPERANQHDRLINVANGMLDWRTGELLDHDPDYLSTIQIPVEYNPSAKCPQIEGFLLTTLPGDCIEMTLEWSGYLLTPSTHYQKALVVVGPGGNGKSTYLSLTKAFLGNENVSNVPIQELSEHRFKRAELQGKLANIFADLDAAALKSSSYFKMIVTGDEIDAERKYSHPFTFKPFARLIFSANAMPASYDKSQAFYRRWLIVPFPNRFEGEDADPDILAKMTTPEELSGLLNLAVRYLRQLTERGHFEEPETVTKAMADYKKHSDPMTAFLEECCYSSDTEVLEVGKTELYEAYLGFCEESKVKYTEPRTEFNRRLREMFPGIIEKRKRMGGPNPIGIWVGGPALLESEL